MPNDFNGEISSEELLDYQAYSSAHEDDRVYMSKKGFLVYSYGGELYTNAEMWRVWVDEGNDVDLLDSAALFEEWLCSFVFVTNEVEA